MVRREGREGGREGSFAVDGGGGLRSRPKRVGCEGAGAGAAGAAGAAAAPWV